MPFLDDRPRVRGEISPVPVAEKPEMPSAGDTFAAALSRENEIGGLFTQERSPRTPFDPDFDLESAIKPEYREYSSAFIYDNSESDILRTERKIERGRKDDATLRAAGPLGMVAGMTAGTLSPINLLPVGGAVLVGLRAGRRMLEVGKATAKAGFLSTTAQEALLHAQQPTRTRQESVFNVGGATLLSGVLGSAAGLLGAREAARLGKRLESELTVPPKGQDVFTPGEVPLPRSAGAAAAREGDEALKGALGVEKALKFQDPLLRTMTSPSVRARRIIQELAETPLTLEKNAKGEATAPEGLALNAPGAVETRIKMWQAPLSEAIGDMDDLFQRYRLGKPKALGVPRIAIGDKLRGTGEKLSYTEFKEGVAHAMRNGDTHEVAEIAEAAKVFRRKVFDPLKDRAIQEGLLDEGIEVSTAASYLNRVYNKEKIIANRLQFKDVVINHLLRERNKSADKAALASKLSDAEITASRAREDLKGLKRGRNTLLKNARKKSGKLAGRAGTAQQALSKAQTELRRANKRLDDLHALPTAGTVKGKGKITEAQSRMNRAAAEVERATKRAEAATKQHGDAEKAEKALKGKNAELRRAKRESALRRSRLTDAERVFKRAKAEATRAKSRFDETAGAPKDPLDSGGLDAARARAEKTELASGNAEQVAKNLQNDLAEIDNLVTRLRRQTAQNSEEISKAKASLAKARTALKRARKEQEIGEFRGLKEDDDLADVADQIIDRILSTPDGRLPYDAGTRKGHLGKRGDKPPGLRGGLQARKFNIPDKEIEPFLEGDIEMLSRIYTRTMSADVETASRFGSVELTAQMKEVAEEFDALIGKVETQKERNALEGQKKNAIRDIGAVRDRLRGTYGLPNDPDGLIVRAGKAVRSLNYLRLLGGMTLSAIPDLARPVMIHGMTRVYGRALIPYLTNLKKVKLAAQEVKLAGTALDMTLDTRVMAIADVMDDYGRHSKFERALHGATQQFGMVSLMAPWNAALKQWTGLITMTRLLQQAKAWRLGKIAAKEMEYLAANGIDAPMARRIADAFDSAGEVDGAVYFANTLDWEDRGAVEAFRAAVVRDVDRIIVTPGQDKPLWMSTELGKMIGQFKSFAVASSQRTLLAGLQQRDMAALNGAVMAIALGMLAYSLKQMVAGRDVSDDPKIWLAEAFDRSGLAGWVMEANNLSEKLTRGKVGVSFFTGRPISRYASRNIVGAMVGPSAGTLTDFAQVTGAGFAGDWSEADTRALRRVIPLQNVFYLRWLFDNAEHGVNRTIGVK